MFEQHPQLVSTPTPRPSLFERSTQLETHQIEFWRHFLVDVFESAIAFGFELLDLGAQRVKTDDLLLQLPVLLCLFMDVLADLGQLLGGRVQGLTDLALTLRCA